ncbi:hypothetical protein T492DRAFT_1043783 [Pavlovales sp. CCMP2436]|nr:hypothetical protein T492DRAFT_1043783 [Pavlovales sp. CCMP2436]|mmetsp:Transcript_13529/g.32048  ORF Transcript_13529/g.32048 Transcript_13529/m.32048 type:complete len:176 (-) Transcript_13529:109-636(-)
MRAVLGRKLDLAAIREELGRRLDDLEAQIERGAQASPSAQPASAAAPTSKLLRLEDLPVDLAASLSCRKLLSSAMLSSSASTSSLSSLCSLFWMQSVNPRFLFGRAKDGLLRALAALCSPRLSRIRPMIPHSQTMSAPFECPDCDYACGTLRALMGHRARCEGAERYLSSLHRGE